MQMCKCANVQINSQNEFENLKMNTEMIATKSERVKVSQRDSNWINDFVKFFVPGANVTPVLAILQI